MIPSIKTIQLHEMYQAGVIFFIVFTSVVPMIDYSRESFIYMQPINGRMEFQGIDYNRKNPQVKGFHFYLTPNANFCSILVIK